MELSQRTYQLVTWVFLAILLCGAIIGIVVPAGLGWDFANFYDTGRRVAAGQIQDLYNPKSLINGEQPQGTLAFWGTPISAWLYVPLSWLPPRISPNSVQGPKYRCLRNGFRHLVVV